MVYLKSFYAFSRKLKIQTIIGRSLLILTLAFLILSVWQAPDTMTLLAVLSFLPGVFLGIVKGDKYVVTRDSLDVLKKNFPPGFDTRDLYLHLDWVWPTIETHLKDNHLFIIQPDYFLVEDLNEIDWIYTSYGSGRSMYYFFLEIIRKDQRHRIVRLPHTTDMDWSGVSRTKDDLLDLMEFLRRNYPHIRIGYTRERREAFLSGLPWYHRLLERPRFAGARDFIPLNPDPASGRDA